MGVKESNLIEYAEIDLDRTIAKWYKLGINYIQLLGLFIEQCEFLKMKIAAEKKLKP